MMLRLGLLMWRRVADAGGFVVDHLLHWFVSCGSVGLVFVCYLWFGGLVCLFVAYFELLGCLLVRVWFW